MYETQNCDSLCVFGFYKCIHTPIRRQKPEILIIMDTIVIDADSICFSVSRETKKFDLNVKY